MKDNIKITELKNKKQEKKVLSLLEKIECKNLYLLEGIVSENPNCKNLLISTGNNIMAVAHLKLNRYLYIQRLGSSFNLNPKFETTIRAIFSDIKSIFGDKESVQYLKNLYLDEIEKELDYIFMELPNKRFNPLAFPAYSEISEENFRITPNSYPGILRLLISYEIEELEIDPSKIKKEILLKIIELRIKRREMTVLSINDMPIGIAAINAKYNDTCQIGSVYLDKLYRGKGYGALLLSEHIKKLFKMYKRIVLFVKKNNEIAYNLYKKLGFVAKGELEQIIIKKKSE